MPFVGPSTGAEPTRKLNPHVFNIRASPAGELEKIVEHCTTTGMRSFAILHCDDAVGMEDRRAVEAALGRGPST